MNRDSDGDIKIKFDDTGEVSRYIKTRLVWAVTLSGDWSTGGAEPLRETEDFILGETYSQPLIWARYLARQGWLILARLSSAS